jgi:hypothetical protein
MFAGHRPRDLALTLLAADAGPPRARARDQQADRLGGELRRRVLDRLAAIDPEPPGIDAAFAAIIAELGAPTGPTRGVCAQIRAEWEQAFVSPRPGQTSPVLDAALTDLDRLVSERPELGPAGRTLGTLLRAAFREPIPMPHFDGGPDLLRAAWHAGVPAFRAGGATPNPDSDDLHARGLAVAEALAAEDSRALALRDALQGGADFSVWAHDLLGDRAEALEAQTNALKLDNALVRSVVRLALLPPLARVSETLSALRPTGAWSRGACPHCVGPPALAESRGLEQRRHWRCGLCAADWEGDRLRCPFCDETDHRRLSYRFAESEPDRYRLALCATCGGRLPVIATLAPLSAPGLLVAELATIPLELAAG